MDDNIIKFLIRAKRATYAGKGRECEPSRPNSHDFKYCENEMLYIDTYLGGSSFSGEEALWKEGVPHWSMNYFGRITGNGFDGDFLKEALLNVPDDKPFRGPAEYEKGSYKYLCSVDGDFNWFTGYETISYNGAVIYECMFHGGKL